MRNDFQRMFQIAVDSTQIPACLWFLARDKKGTRSARRSEATSTVPVPAFRDRRGHTLFLDARKLGRMVDRRENLSRLAITINEGDE